MKIKFNSDDDFSSNETLKHRNMIVVIRAVFHEDSKYYLQFFLNRVSDRMS